MKLFIFLILTSNIIYAQTIDHVLSINIQGIGSFTDGSTATLEANKAYIVTASWKRQCGTPILTWSGMVNGGANNYKISLPVGSTNYIRVDIRSTNSHSCSGNNKCLINFKTQSATNGGGTSGSSNTRHKPKPNFYMNGSNESAITIKPQTKVTFIDKSYPKAKKWAYGIMVTLHGKRQRVFHVHTKKPTVDFTFIEVGVYRVYFWAENSVGRSNVIFKTVTVKK